MIEQREPLTQARIFRAWWPLAASWLFMGAELPILTAFLGRSAEAEAHLGAWGAIVFPVALVIEAPIISLLAASTALAVDWVSYSKLLRFTNRAGAVLTAVHVAVAFTPLFDLLARRTIGVPEELVEPGRIGLQLLTPWSWAIAYRRFHQGVLIRFDRSRAVGVGTLVRLVALVSTLLIGELLTPASGIAVGASAISTAVLAEAAFSRWAAREPLLELRGASIATEALTRKRFLRFYVPLAFTPLLTLLIQPAGAWAMSGMPNPLLSLAAWPAVYGLVFLTRSVGFAFNEVVVSQLGRPDAARELFRFALRLGMCTSFLLAILAGTPLADFWFGTVYDLEGPLASLCAAALGLACLMPGYAALQSWFQGSLVYAERTRAITEAVVLYMAIAIAGLLVWVEYGTIPGIYAALVTFTVAGILQTIWLGLRARSVRQESESASDGA